PPLALHDALPISTPRSVRNLAANDAESGGGNKLLIITKTNARSTVHRTGNMDYIGVLRYDASGKVVGERRFIGLFTSGAYMRRPQDVPLVRTTVAEVMERSGLKPDSPSGKALKHILETLPRDELFQCSADELYSVATGILGLHERSRTRLFLRRDRFGRFFSALAFIPRDRYNTSVRERIEAMLMQALQGETIDTQVQVGESTLARLHMVIRPPFGVRPELDPEVLEAEMARRGPRPVAAEAWRGPGPAPGLPLPARTAGSLRRAGAPGGGGGRHPGHLAARQR